MNTKIQPSRPVLGIPPRTTSEWIDTPPPKQRERNYFICVESIKRAPVYPSPAEYRFPILQPLRDVIRVELVGGTLPSTPATTPPYVILDVNELNHMDVGSANGAFNVLFTAPGAGSSTHSIVQTQMTQTTTLICQPSIPRLNYLSIALRAPDGTLMDYGTGFDPSNQHMLMFKFTVLEAFGQLP
ncbi:uncharacterized protein BJ171DRAFT_593491 [Polychytrium aggregatum]|uniref:uncharacterized protein n=1 Tax=Polychytrium aggregatum TaxID=110093 RepID=UPI0022FE25B8|nr:uncharacterized protein BJ171DRAFT_593491 [Polychytrium aggregatum]KAI9187545.1 hypothetical protein BJ171DRAFT_593491 [Polychytrium aggregatum]